MRGIRKLLVCCCIVACTVVHPARAPCAEARDGVDPIPPTPLSLGQPTRWRLSWGGLAGYSIDQPGTSGRVYLNLSHHVLGPKLGGFEVTLEGAAGVLGDQKREDTGGFATGLYFGLPWLAMGNEYAGEDLGGNTFAFSLRFPERRGGMLGASDLLRVDYHPGRKEILAGISLRWPFESCRPSRPRRTGVVLPRRAEPEPDPASAAFPLDSLVERPLADAFHAMEWIDRVLVPTLGDEWIRDEAVQVREHLRRPGHALRDEEARYHRALDRAFTSAMGADSALGAAVAALAESVLFRDVLVPFNRRLGQEKSPRHAGGFCAPALLSFGSALDSLLVRGGVPDSARPPAVARASEIFRRVLHEVKEISFRAGERWKNPFLVFSNRGALAWIPLQFGLRPEQYDTQAEWDGVLGALTGEPFTGGNQVQYLMMEQFHVELKEMIRDTRDYQVTIVHDFRGRVPGGAADMYGWDLVVDGYLAAFQDAIRQLNDGTRDRLPQFFLFLDANYYEANGSRGIVSYLENLYDPPNPLLRPREMQVQVDAAHDSLLEAVRTSAALKGVGEDRLRDAIKVHVSITNPFDPAFMLDVTRRDHRKIAYRDVSEEHPERGVGIVTGQGIGEHYNGTGWEDRSLEIRGPTLAALKTATRRLMAQHGFREREIPEALRERVSTVERDPDARVRGGPGQAAIWINETGYGVKEATVAKAAMYNLAPAGSVLLCYDSVWISDFWAGMFLSAALRGARVFPVGPGPFNAPSNATATLHFLRENLRRLLICRRIFAPEIERAGGELRVGLYVHDAQTQDFRRRIECMERGYRSHGFLRELLPLHPALWDSLARFKDRFPEHSALELRVRPRPFLHMKNQLFASAEAFRIYGLPEWAPTVIQHLEIRVLQSHGMRSDPIDARVVANLASAFQRQLNELGPGGRERSIFAFTTGSHNQNPRSMLLDGEVLVAISGNACIMTLIDTGFILCIAEWPETEEELDRLFPRRRPPFHLGPFLRAMEDQS